MGRLLADYKRFQRLTGSVASALALGITFFAATKLATPSASADGSQAYKALYAFFSALVPICVLLSGGFLAYARGKFDYRADILDLEILVGNVDAKSPVSDLSQERRSQTHWTNDALTAFSIAILFALIGAVGLVCVVVLSAVQPFVSPPGPQVVVVATPASVAPPTASPSPTIDLSGSAVPTGAVP